MDIQDKITKQLEAGFSIPEIKTNLAADGYSNAEIERQLGHIPAELAQVNQPVSPWRIVWIVVIGLVGIVRIFRLFDRSPAAGLLGLGVAIAVTIGVLSWMKGRR